MLVRIRTHTGVMHGTYEEGGDALVFLDKFFKKRTIDLSDVISFHFRPDTRTVHALHTQTIIALEKGKAMADVLRRRRPAKH